MSEKKQELLKKLVTELEQSESLEQTSLFTAEELGTPADVVRTMINELGPDLISVLGEFLFLPFKDEEMLYFCTAITVTEEIPADARADLAVAVSRINSILPCGSFALGEESSTLIFKYTILIPAGADEEEQKRMMLTAVDNSIEMVDRNVGYLALVLSGDRTPESMMELVTGRPGGDDPSDKEA